MPSKEFTSRTDVLTMNAEKSVLPLPYPINTTSPKGRTTEHNVTYKKCIRDFPVSNLGNRVQTLVPTVTVVAKLSCDNVILCQ